MNTEITASEMRRIDANCGDLGLLPLQLMENAGASVARAIRARFPGTQTRIVVLAGTGNNGGDGFVAARHLLDYNPLILLLGRARDIATDESRRNWEILRNLSADLREIKDSSELPELEPAADIVIDAMLGTGVRGSVREPVASAIDLINASSAFVLSIDVPSGFNPGNFEKVVRADLTITNHRMKEGLSGRPEITGEIEVADIGIPTRATLIVGAGDLPPTRNARSHKGDNGRVLVIGGGAFTGAPALSALAALRAGADWVTVAAPKSVAGTIAGFSPDLIVHSLSGKYLAGDDADIVNALIRKHNVTVIGMGIGRESETAEAVSEIIRSNPDARFVIDADALHALAMPMQPGTPPIITPHAGEFRMLGGDVSADLDERCELVMDFSKRNRVVTLLKGDIDVISDGRAVRINRTGNSGMTVGGTGDVLAGVAGAIFANTGALAAASAGALIVGTAGDLAFLKYGYGLLATDVIECIPDAMRR
uniref:Bifunctional NAD(P)H-hydrate repair enzyme n=1 Tax=Candidatus Methanogaster sp. ANME-2c ERB4 TaxID=2759911 RepID=A0A7G9YNU1_9EURY|nr:ATP-dependent (S)-NAD(P)H-hydrate dehydratase [Methanosarcinales archaeon ANME-2c ERB4]QNO49788.1 ATP-dependent (S)-NAD(P)H-hydrate dehydratase [Methanosarcinales archaeon ANME-2c ERB4]QNO50098.1 ATP-dependent (S)-NAD(P)H-hydrate dehydratase [Methanosarcinales archaeon ANME-2c ERB4]